MPRLLVTMATRDSAQTLRAAVGSALSAMPRDSVLGVWCDGTSDDSASILESMQDARLRYWTSDVSRGSGYARQAILSRVDSQFVANIDSDDICLPWRFQWQRRQLADHDYCFSTPIKFCSKVRWWPSVPVHLTPSDTAASLLLTNILNHSSFFGRRSSLEGVGGYENIRFAQDYELWLRSCLHGARIVHSPIPVVAYRLTPSQVSNRTDYWSSVSQQKQISDSYLALLEMLTSQGGYGFRRSDEEVQDPRITSVPLRRWFEMNSSRLSPSFRAYYRLRLRRSGTIWREPDWRQH